VVLFFDDRHVRDDVDDINTPYNLVPPYVRRSGRGGTSVRLKTPRMRLTSIPIKVNVFNQFLQAYQVSVMKGSLIDFRLALGTVQPSRTHLACANSAGLHLTVSIDLFVTLITTPAESFYNLT
jgi:hypothetical protein